jgi:putative transposase
MKGTISPELMEVSAKDWEVARRRFEVIQPLATCSRRTRSSVQQAAKQLQLSVPQAYRLLRRFDPDPRLTSLLPARRGRKQGHSRLSAIAEEVIQTTIDEVYLTRQKPRVAVFAEEVRRRCKALEVTPASPKSVRRRLQGRPPHKSSRGVRAAKRRAIVSRPRPDRSRRRPSLIFKGER